MRNRLIATMTICSLAAGVLAAPAANAAPAFNMSVVKVNGTNMCVFTADDTDDTVQSAMLTARKQYRELREKLRNDIRGKLPELKDDLEAADKITGTQTTPATGSLENSQLAEIISRVSEVMVEQGYRKEEVYLAFHHTPKSEEIRKRIAPENLDLMPDIDIYTARELLNTPGENANSVRQRAKRFHASAAQLRDWVRELQKSSSISLLSSVNADNTNRLLESTKHITQLTPTALESIVRASLDRCQGQLNVKNSLDGSTSSRALKNPVKALSSDRDSRSRQGQGNLWTGSAELSSGKNTSSVSQYKELSSGNSSDDKERSRKLSILVAFVGLIGFVVNLLVRASPLAKTATELFNYFTGRGEQNPAPDQAAAGNPADAPAAGEAPAAGDNPNG